MLAAVVLAFVGAMGAAPVPAAHCKVVTKKVHGKKLRVRVCRKAKSLPQAGTVAAKIPVGGKVLAIAADDTAVWVLSDNRVLSRVDPATNKVVATVALPDSEWPEGNVAVGDGSVWVTVASPSTVVQPELDSLLRIDPATNRIVATIHVGPSPEGIGVAPDSVWTANHRSAWDRQAQDATGAYTVSRVSTSTDKETDRPVVEHRQKGSDSHAYWCCGPQGMTYAAGSIWVTDPKDSGNGLVQRVDPARNALVATISIANSNAEACGNVVGDAASVWLVSGCDSTYVVRIDPQTNQIAATINMGIGQATQDIALGFGSVWVTTYASLTRIDPATNKIIARTPLSQARRSIATGAGSIWLGNATQLIRVTPG
jgi:streptogramin lyase